MWNFASARGLSPQKIDDDFNLNYSRDNDQRFTSDVVSLSELMRVYDEAMAEGDLLTARCALVEAQIFAHNLSNFFWDIKEDLVKVASEKIEGIADDRWEWPPLPQRYSYPDRYQFRDEKRVVDIFGSKQVWNESRQQWESI
ncbi:hypothetical protein [Cupriavidus campinensis]|uniref:Uncharacterized protein n=1 Tax=Cupriavidus campinensis TaxID=151783 RepID=A0AAE9I3N5_9BURK|nr:hypothetical protein [Cupriavidus campinensis]URF06797.1 hypothetical protein M5D45_27370 [Cupriavidus campinensis]